MYRYVYISLGRDCVRIFGYRDLLQDIYCSWYFIKTTFDIISSFLEHKGKLSKITENCFKLENIIRLTKLRFYGPTITQNHTNFTQNHFRIQ